MRKPTLPLHAKPQVGIFMDLDETYRPIHSSSYQNSGIRSLEDFWLKKSQERQFIAGWVTGSNLDAVIKKTSDYVNLYPHFVASSLGSEFHWIEDGDFIESTEWNNRIKATGYSSDLVSDIISSIKHSGINLIKQKDMFQGKYKSSYFLESHSVHQFSDDIQFIKSLVQNRPLKLMVTQCSPAAGDPENFFDVEFLPLCCGKDQAVKFVKDLYDIPVENTFAFGDSCNDLAMFSVVGNAFWVENADASARQNPYVIAEGDYCHGILAALSRSHIFLSNGLD